MSGPSVPGKSARPTMSVTEAAQRVGVNAQTVRRWIDEQDRESKPVASRERDDAGAPIPGRHRRPFVDAVEAWIRQREGETLPGPTAGAEPDEG